MTCCTSSRAQRFWPLRGRKKGMSRSPTKEGSSPALISRPGRFYSGKRPWPTPRSFSKSTAVSPANRMARCHWSFSGIFWRNTFPRKRPNDKSTRLCTGAGMARSSLTTPRVTGCSCTYLDTLEITRRILCITDEISTRENRSTALGSVSCGSSLPPQGPAHYRGGVGALLWLAHLCPLRNRPGQYPDGDSDHSRGPAEVRLLFGSPYHHCLCSQLGLRAGLWICSRIQR